MKEPIHIVYFLGSVAAAGIAAAGIAGQAPVVYGIIPGIIGGVLALIAAYRFLIRRRDLIGFTATTCGFVFYQAYQANPVTLPDFTTYIAEIPLQDQIVGIILANLTAAFLLLAYHLVGAVFGGIFSRMVPAPSQAERTQCDRAMLVGFILVFCAVALPNVLFGKVIIGPIQNVINQRASWNDASLSGYAVFGGDVGGSFSNVTLWAVSLFLLWLYMLGSKYRAVMWILGPLVLIWTAAVALTGSRTYLVALAVAFTVYILGNPKVGKKALFHLAWAVPFVFIVLQVSSLFRTAGLQSFDAQEFAKHAFEIRGNEGANSEMDGVEYFRTELAERGIAANPIAGALRGLFLRPIEGSMMIIPRTVFPWKLDDASAVEYNLFFQNVRLGVPSDVTFIGASPGLIGRELIRYGYLGPLTLLFWMGVILNFSQRFFDAGPESAYHRLVAATLISFLIAQSRDFVSVWFIPYTPAAIVLIVVTLLLRPPSATPHAQAAASQPAD